MIKNKNILFITWDGPHVKYLETLFFPIFQKLQEDYGYSFHIIQFIWDAKEVVKIRTRLFESAGMKYKAIPVNRRFPKLGLILAKLTGAVFIAKYIRHHQISVLMPRATTSMGIVKGIAKKTGVKLLFDADGFSQDERVDFNGLSKDSIQYKLYRKTEQRGFQEASSIICRSEKAKKIIVERAGISFDPSKVFVVHNGTFVPKLEKNGEKKQICSLVYAGSIGPQYRFEDMIRIYQQVKSEFPAARLTILTVQKADAVNLLQKSFPGLENEVVIKSVSADSVYGELCKHDIGISLRQEAFSMLGVAPIKVSEYLAAGLGIIYSPGIGDLDDILREKPFAYCWKGFPENDSLNHWVEKQLKEDFKVEILSLASTWFSLDKTVQIYNQALQYGGE
jgi:glycosyltransferase involved in cell wall biosynthesis